jgi:hypothetical protein
MRKIGFVFAGLGVVLLSGLFFFGWWESRSERHPHRHGGDPVSSKHNHDHGSGKADASREGVQSDVRHSQLLDEPGYQEPAANPLVRIVSREKLFDGPLMAARFSADGKYYLVTGPNYEGLWLVDREGGGYREVSDGLMAGWRPVTTQEGEVIYRTAEIDDQGNMTFAIWLYDPETGRHEELYRGLNEDVYPPWLSRDEDLVLILRDGEWIAYPLRESAARVSLGDRDEGLAYSDGGNVWYRRLDQDLPLRLTPPGGESFGGEVASPCGRYVAYLSGNTNSVIIADLAAGSEVDIGEGSNLAWHPEGRFLLYDVTSDDGYRLLASDLFVVEPDGRNRQRVTFDPELAYHDPAWSPDGKYIVAEDALTGAVYLLGVESLKRPEE